MAETTKLQSDFQARMADLKAEMDEAWKCHRRACDTSPHLIIHGDVEQAEARVKAETQHKRWRTQEANHHQKAREIAAELSGRVVEVTGTVGRSESNFGGGTEGLIGSASWQTENWTVDLYRHRGSITIRLLDGDFIGPDLVASVEFNKQPATFRLFDENITIVPVD